MRGSILFPGRVFVLAWAALWVSGCPADETPGSVTGDIVSDAMLDAKYAFDVLQGPLFPDASEGDGLAQVDIFGQDVPPGEFGAACNNNAECYGGWCVEGPEGYLCTKMCTETCPEGFDCKSVFSGASDVVFLCLPRIKKLCFPCADDIQCTGGACLTLDGSGQCAYECASDDDCPDTGYTCAEDSLGEKPGTFCQPITGSCMCTEALDGSQRTCFAENDHGLCVGVQTCAAESGWGTCSAPEAAEEICDGLDNNCNALIDEGIEDGGACVNEEEGVGSCPGTLVCLGSQGYICQASIPEVEVCDFKDNDCDDLVDEDFKDEDGVFSLTAHCGTCGNDCTDTIPHGVGKCTDNNGTPVCVVDTCDEDYVAINDFQCALPPDVSCQPCAADGDCYGGTCVELDGQKVCLSPCGEQADSCQEGYECTELEPGIERCMPITKSCVCSELTDGQIRTCNNDNDFGICYGQETCDAQVGWVGCTAVEPIEETCDGVDNNCNGLIDEGIEEGGVCENAVEGVGSCEGVLVCLGPIGYVCQAETPELETCDFKDNDCDGVIDEDFKDADGVFSTTPHCGTCGNDCAVNIPNGVGKCTDNNGTPVCVVDTCDQDYVAINAFQCALPPDVSCQPCTADDDCYGGSCIELDGQDVCVSPCGAQAWVCQDNYNCEELEPGVERCIPASKSCICSALTDGQTRTCKNDNDFGICYGQETCDAQVGWSACTAKEPVEETCDGVDNNCNGLIDEGVEEGGACANTVEAVGSCEGILVCVGQDGYVCQAETPEVETCDFNDNDCDGEIDEDFTDDAGVFSTTPHCGTCGNDCAVKIPNGVGKCTDNNGTPVCVVDTCDQDYVAINAFQCALPPDVSCQPCTADDDCYGGSCIELDGQNVCVSPCGALGGACQGNFNCQELEPGVERCIPITDSCICSALTDGQTRTCKNANDAGICYGEETCDGQVGWSACTAKEPLAETCNGLDDDCNGAADDGVAPPAEPCLKENAFGACVGTWFCSDSGNGGVAWWCSAVEPAADLCDYQDNNCDGTADEDYKFADTDVYVDFENCGACGISCDGAIPNATAACSYNDGKPGCTVVECDLGYYQVGPLTCLPVADTLCAPCETDVNCLIPGDQCLQMDGAAYCGRDCSADNLYGVPEGTCPPGYACTDQQDGSQQCVPESNSCTCLDGDDGKTRSCIETNDLGSCFGTETCDPNVGWSACTATPPTPEVCDGKDNDCNAVADDVPGRGDKCDITNANGTCSGLLDCVDGKEDLVCVGDTPALEICNYDDDDCDGLTDEGFDDLYESCEVGVGLCKRFGISQCSADGKVTECSVLPGDPSKELCDNLDNDCDGDADEDFPTVDDVCTAGIGGCKTTGVVACTDDGLGAECSAVEGNAVAETCNGVDDDCDGKKDNNIDNVELCANQNGVCAGSTRTCDGAGGWSVCVGPEYGPQWEQTELACDGLDNDCDGKTDNGLPAKPCANQLGVCAGTFATCDGKNGFKACDAAVYGDNYEADETICDSLDNDCDGQTDEGFVDPVTSEYESNEACGSCFVNCTTVYDKPNAYGTCDSSGAPTCVMNCDPGYYDMNLVPDDGCEFYLDPDTIYVSADDVTALDVGGCGQGPSGTGPGNFPCASIAQGLIEAAGGYTNVNVADGLYVETVTMVNGINLMGGYRADTWERHLDTTLTTLRGVDTIDGHEATVVAKGITKSTLLEGFEIDGQNSDQAKGNSYGVYVASSDSSLIIRNNTISAGNGGKGLDGKFGDSGANGVNGAGRNQGGGSPALYDAHTVTGGGFCSSNNDRQYDNGGKLSCGAIQVSGGDGGGNTCPPDPGNEGSGADGANGLNSGGFGGDAGDDGEINGGFCYLPAGSMTGSPGTNGKDGVAGSGGGGCSQVYGVVLGGHWVGNGGGAGVLAKHGSGGGGGGSGGGGYCTVCQGNKDRLGGHGGGGGSGGCGGDGGKAGSGGGGSFGVFIAGGATPTVQDNTVLRGNGGVGGAGGTAGSGGVGGNGGDGGACPDSCHCHKAAGKGGEGGTGGHGGGGGGGCGGLSYGIYSAVNSQTLCKAVNAVSGGAFGGGGEGGLSLGKGGADGADGLLGDCYVK